MLGITEYELFLLVTPGGGFGGTLGKKYPKTGVFCNPSCPLSLPSTLGIPTDSTFLIQKTALDGAEHRKTG